ncbi:MAG: hypothetical protein H6808_03685 [Phycisphaera sp.]|nr:hypothetical protein [Phycisphaera sp.]
MRRLLVHPALRWLIPLAAVIWIGSATQIGDQDERGLLPSLTSILLPSPVVLRCYFGYDDIYFYLKSDQSIGVAANESDLGSSAAVQDAVFAVASHDSGRTRRFGLVFTPVVTSTSSATVNWINRSPASMALTVNDLEAALVPYRTIYSNPAPTDAELVELDRTGLNSCSTFVAQLPLVVPSQTHWDIDPVHLVGEFAFYTLVLWWLLTLRYARRVWPKPDGSRCPSCNYPTAGLMGPVCPECGKPLPNAAHA